MAVLFVAWLFGTWLCFKRVVKALEVLVLDMMEAFSLKPQEMIDVGAGGDRSNGVCGD